ncbi:MAG: YidC/Oxa1 family membrane protein insertase, partial [Actinomycetota bacterium]
MSVFNQIKGFLFDVLVFFQRATEPLFARQSWWMAIVLLTVAVRVVLIPLTIKQVRSTRAMQQVQPELKKLQAKHKGDKQKLNEEVMKLYREKGVNPLAGCLPLVLQFPIFIALYRMLVDANLGKNLVGGGLVCLKEAIKAGTCLPKPFLWAPDLAQRASGIS